MESLEQIKARIEQAVPGVQLEIIPNGSPGNPASLWVDAEHALAVARFLRDDEQLRLDYASNVTGVDWPDKVVQQTVKVLKTVDGVEKEFDAKVEARQSGYLEAVYHLYSMALKHGPLVLRTRTVNREEQTHLPSLTPLYRSADFQEREIYDLYGIIFDGHPDLRRLLMWEGFEDFPMRKDYEAPDDYEFEPTAHNQVLEKARKHYPPKASNG
jgi:NADH-quinone oxidoreductase subunit C